MKMRKELWIVMAVCFVAYCSGFVGTFWSPLRYGQAGIREAATWLAILSYGTALVFLSAYFCQRLLPFEAIFISFPLIGAIFGLTGWFLEAKLYESYPWGKGLEGFYLFATLVSSCAVATVTALIRFFTSKGREEI